MPHVAVRIFADFATLKRLASSWSQLCQKTAVYEHIGEKTSKVHCHFGLLNCRVSTERLKQLARELGHEYNGNKDWSFKTWDGDNEYITYMSKGTLEPQYYTGYSVEELSALKALWVDKSAKQKMTPNQLLFDKFMDYLEDRSAVVVEFKALKGYAVDFAFNHFGRIWDVNTAKGAKMCAITYAMREGLAFENVETKMSMF